MRNLSDSLLSLLILFLGTFVAFGTTTGRDPIPFNSQAKRLETFSSRYEIPTNDPSLIAKLPFTFGYRFTDDYGTMQTREEKTDPNGAKTGSYSFVDANGIYRRVDYIADRHGFRATVRTNEPGIMSADPAHVSVRNEDEKNIHISEQPLLKNSPEMDYSSHIFSRYNVSSSFGQERGHFVNSVNNFNTPNQKLYFNNGANYGRNPSLRPVPPNGPDFDKNVNFYKGSPFPQRVPLRPVLLPQLGISNPVPYSDPKGFNVDKFFNSPNINPEFIFGDKASNPNYNSNPQYPLNGQQYAPPTRYPRRLRDSRIRGRSREYKIHTPRGYENYPDLPLYRDK